MHGSSAGRDTRYWPQWPGFKSQVLQKFHIIFPFQVQCNAHIDAHHTLQHQPIHVSQSTHIKGKDWETCYTPVKCISLDPESQPILTKMGQAFLINTLQIGVPPPWFAYFNYFFIFYLFIYYFNCYVLLFYLINSYKNIKTLKIQKGQKKI